MIWRLILIPGLLRRRLLTKTEGVFFRFPFAGSLPIFPPRLSSCPQCYSIASSARIATPAVMNAVGLAIVADEQAGARPVPFCLCEALRSNPGSRSLPLCLCESRLRDSLPRACWGGNPVPVPFPSVSLCESRLRDVAIQSSVPSPSLRVPSAGRGNPSPFLFLFVWSPSFANDVTGLLQSKTPSQRQTSMFSVPAPSPVPTFYIVLTSLRRTRPKTGRLP